MGDINQILYLQHFVKQSNGPILEIGSKDYGSTSSFREVFPNAKYVGIDLEPGKNVDQVVDLTQGLGDLSAGEFELGICCSVLEHVDRPWIMAENITQLIKSGGILFMSVPWVWRYHAYPDDYFRFSWRGIMSLFPDFEWSTMHYSTTVKNEFIEISEQNKGGDNAMAAMVSEPNGSRKYLPYLMVNMLGVKK